MFQDDTKNKKAQSDFLKNNIASESNNISSMTESFSNEALDSVVNDIAPVDQIKSGVEKAKSLMADAQSKMSSVENAFNQNLNLADTALPIESVKKSELPKTAEDELSDSVRKTGLYFTVQVGELPVSTFDVVEFELNEGLSELYSLTLTLSSRDANIDLQNQLLQKAQFIVYSDGQKQRTVNGIVESAVRGNSGFKRTYYTFVVRPPLWLLTLTQDSRIYHFKSVPDIIDEILREFNITCEKQLMDTHNVREYTTMKRESYADFIFRLASEEGISFWSEESQLFYSDSHLGMTAGLDLIYNPHPQSVTKEATINDLTFGAFMRPTQAKVKDYRYSHPDVSMDAKSKANQPLPLFEVYDSYGRYQDEQTAQQFSQYRLDALRAESESGQASSNSIQLMPGKIFQLSEHPTDSMNDRWQVIRITHKGTLPQSLDNESDGKPANLTNQFTFIPGKSDWRPPFIHKPQADGDEVAMVVGPDGEEIYVNEDGAVKVHFHWNRYDQPNENASCWVRVVQNWNGNGFGFLATPRIGQEVLVSYLNGDIDRPIITGTVYNGNNRPPVDLPASKTQMSIKSKTHKGTGFNELRFEDEGGKEEIYIHGQKDFSALINNDTTWDIRNDHKSKVGNNSTWDITGTHDVTVNGPTRIKGNSSKSESIEGESHLKVGGAYVIKTGDEVSVEAGAKITLAAGTELTIKAGSQFIALKPSGIFTSAPFNLGSGSPGTGKGLNLNMPGTLEPLPAPTQVQQATLAKSAPYCEECEKCKLGGCSLPDLPSTGDKSSMMQSLISGGGIGGATGASLSTSGFAGGMAGMPNLGTNAGSPMDMVSGFMDDSGLSSSIDMIQRKLTDAQNMADNAKNYVSNMASDAMGRVTGLADNIGASATNGIGNIAGSTNGFVGGNVSSNAQGIVNGVANNMTNLASDKVSNLATNALQKTFKV